MESIASLGIRHVELFANNFHLDPRLGKHDCDELATCLRKHDLKPVSLHMPFAGILVNPTGPSPQEVWMGLVRECFGLVERLSIPSIVVHPQFLASDCSGHFVVQEVMDLVKGEILPWAETARTRVLVENLPSYLFPTRWRWEHFGEVWERGGDSGLGWCLDCSHALCSGLDPVEEIRRSLPFLKEIHLSDNLPGTGADLHRPLGEGSADWRSIFDLLIEKGFDGDLILEIDGGEDPAGGVDRSARLIRGFLEARDA